MSTHTQPTVRAYLACVRTALADLPAGEIDEVPFTVAVPGMPSE
ncbi:hypothetical protein [Saccharomonospora sp.]|nr:hypothetical protein [Saccharomonospora sp.]